MGYHRDENVPVAVKILTSELAQSQRLVTAFRKEVQTIAGLSHPSIVVVLDYGQITSEAVEASKGLLTPKSPYLVMEYAASGSLVDVWPQRTSSWPGVRSVLLTLLDALAGSNAWMPLPRDLAHWWHTRAAAPLEQIEDIEGVCLGTAILDSSGQLKIVPPSR